MRYPFCLRSLASALHASAAAAFRAAWLNFSQWRRRWGPIQVRRWALLTAIFTIGSLPRLAPTPPALKPPSRAPDQQANSQLMRSLAPEKPSFPFVINERAAAGGDATIAAMQPERSKEDPGPDQSATTAPAGLSRKKIVAGWLPYWDMSEGMRIVDEFPDALTEVSPFWYQVAADGRVADSPGGENNEVLAKLRARGKTILPTIMSADGTTVSGVLNDGGKRARHLKSIMSKVKKPVYDGIDIDYENLGAADRDVFSQFIRDLATRVHRQGKILTVTVNSKTSDPGTWNGAQSHDYRAIGKAADYVRIMAYDQHYAGGPAGPVAAIDWVEKVATFALSQIPKDKIVLGVPAYGYDWPAQGRATSVVHDEAAARSLANNAPIQWDAQSATSYFHYADQSGSHTVWFENGRSLEAKIALAKKLDLAGVAIWRLGREDKTVYTTLKSMLSSD